jgi:hypothetical protein
MSDDKTSEALDLERLRLTGAIEEINREYQGKMTEVASDFRRRGLGISGPFGKAIADTQMARAKAIIAKHLELRRETLSKEITFLQACRGGRIPRAESWRQCSSVSVRPTHLAKRRRW